MHYLRTWMLISFCVSVTFLQSENLPKKQLSKLSLFQQIWDYDAKISSGEVNILSYNTWGLPIALVGHDQTRRFGCMGDSIANLNADIIGLQETFHPSLRRNLLSELSGKYYTYSDYRCDRSIVKMIDMDCYGGLMTFSSFPIIEEIFYPFPTDNSFSFIEKTGRKGLLVSYIQHGEKVICVVNTHLYAGNNAQSESIRLKEMKYINAILSNNIISGIDEIIMIGDFNIHHPNVACSDVYDFITNNMGYSDSKPRIDERDFTYDLSNAYTPGKEKGTKLDYVFIKRCSGEPPMIIEQSRAFDSQQPMSDHFGWKVKWVM